jgi:uncharacterized membrane protein YdjX (TVP38/TMEM64 family)
VQGPAPTRAAPSPRTLRLLALALVAVAVALAWRTGLLAQLAEPSRVASEVLALGAWGAVAFLVAYTVLQPFGVPGMVFVVAASLIWPWPIAFALSMTGTMAASVVGFAFARLVARDWVSGMVPARFRAYDEALARRGFATVFALRFVFWMPQVLHVFFGVSRVGFWTHFWGSFAGYLVPLFLIAFFGPRVLEAMRTAPPSVWIGVGLAAAVGAGLAWSVRRRCVAHAG